MYLVEVRNSKFKPQVCSCVHVSAWHRTGFVKEGAHTFWQRNYRLKASLNLSFYKEGNRPRDIEMNQKIWAFFFFFFPISFGFQIHLEPCRLRLWVTLIKYGPSPW